MNQIQQRLKALLPKYDYNTARLTRALRAAGLGTDNPGSVRHWLNGESYPMPHYERQLLDTALPLLEDTDGRRPE